MSEEPKPTYSAREIVLEFFPATDERLIPRPRAFRVHRNGQGELLIRDHEERVLSRLQPVKPAGNPTTQLCCDLCGWSSNRLFLQVMRAEVPGSSGRRFRYVTACRNTDDCEVRRLDDDPVRALLSPR